MLPSALNDKTMTEIRRAALKGRKTHNRPAVAEESLAQAIMVLRSGVSECDIPVDIVLRSSDKALIGAHQTNLAQFSEGFPSPSDVNSSSEPVDLTEDGGTLNLLMQFMHKRRHPNLSIQETSISTTLKLAEAAEKYLVYAAMNACYIRIDDPRALRDNSLEALKYAVKFDYPDLADRAALWTLPAYGITSITESFGKGNEAAVLAWVRFRAQYSELAMEKMLAGSSGCLKVRGNYTRCTVGHWDIFYKAVIDEIPRTQWDFLNFVIQDGVYQNRLYDLCTRHRAIIEGCPTGSNLSIPSSKVTECSRMLIPAPPRCLGFRSCTVHLYSNSGTEPFSEVKARVYTKICADSEREEYRVEPIRVGATLDVVNVPCQCNGGLAELSTLSTPHAPTHSIRTRVPHLRGLWAKDKNGSDMDTNIVFDILFYNNDNKTFLV
ncbi:hypothetical protein NMY22_g7923 [Coprinellus aureogranulatus]|nr:hypothetical protein NMY22_g7923 [Coprinellus aureogranulatus]